MSPAPRPTGPAFCGWCPSARHDLCPGECACAEVEHRPGLGLRARFWRYIAPDESHLPERERSTRWAAWKDRREGAAT